MDVVKAAIEKPVAVLVGVMLIILFGGVALATLPYQLSPNVTEPVISVSTFWPGATPYEIEREIIEGQEKALKGVSGLIEMESSCYNSKAKLSLKFAVGTDIETALLRVSNKLDEVPDYPDMAERPVVSATGASASPVIWMILRTRPGNKRDVQTYRTFFENEVRQYLERVKGVADFFIGGGRREEMHIIVDPVKLAAHNMTLQQMAAILKKENISISAGSLGVGRRDYRIRMPAEFSSPEEIESIVLSSSGEHRFAVRDVATVRRGFQKATVAMLYNAEPGITIGVKPESGTNILDMTNAINDVVDKLNAGKLKEHGLLLEWVYDQRPYIEGAIHLVQKNILVGSILAIAVLFVFLQSISATIIVAVAIPISIVGAFIIFAAAGRSLNVVSMAGISFAVGMLVDNAIVVLENIDRHRHMGKKALTAAYDGTNEVWGAVLASTLTTVAVFLPVIFMEQEAGQLFKDIAIAVTCAIILSLFVSVLVIPMLARQFYGFSEKKASGRAPDDGLRNPAILSFVRTLLVSLTALGNKVSGWIMGLLDKAISVPRNRIVTVLSLTLVSALMVWAFFPKMEYLPQGNRNLILSILIPPPGLSYDERLDIGESIFAISRPHFNAEVDGIPPIKDMFFVSAPTINLFGAICAEEERASEMRPLFKRIINSIPGMLGVSIQASIFEQRLGTGRTVSVDISGEKMEKIVAAAGTLLGTIMKHVPGAQVRPVPSLELAYPEVRFIPERERLRAAGLSTQDLGVAIDIILDGRKIGDYNEDGKRQINLVLKGTPNEVKTPDP